MSVLSVVRSPSLSKFSPLAGVLLGALAGGVYWLAALLWPTSVAVALAMLSSAWLTHELRDTQAASRLDIVCQVFYLLIKYNALMALSAAKLPFAVGANVALGMIMICAYAASRALRVSLSASGTKSPRVSHLDMTFALLIGMSPSALLGIPGLAGLAAAILMSIGCAAYLKSTRGPRSEPGSQLPSMLTETGFYLGALATWSYV